MSAPHSSVRAQLDRYPRLPLAEYPTPVHLLPHLSEQLRRSIFLKRDDEIGPGGGGNKTRKLEYLLAEAQQRGMRVFRHDGYAPMPGRSRTGTSSMRS